jgi:ABC-type transport system substrate-binding protein
MEWSGRSCPTTGLRVLPFTSWYLRLNCALASSSEPPNCRNWQGYPIRERLLRLDHVRVRLLGGQPNDKVTKWGSMDRRAFLKAAAGAGASAAGNGLAAPAIAQRADARTLRLVPHADLANFDPIANSAYIARNAGILVWDTLYGVDSSLQPRRQMVESEEVSADGLIWTFRLRPGLKFHDGEPVLAKDAVASINRWAVREPMGGMIKAVENELVAADDRTFRWSLKKSFPKMLLALGKISTPCCFIMPARMAATDPFKQVSEYVGSGPLRFLKNEWVPGAQAAFERFPGYEPRPAPASWIAGGKRILVDRIEWITIPDSATAAAALQSGLTGGRLSFPTWCRHCARTATWWWTSPIRSEWSATSSLTICTRPSTTRGPAAPS